MTVQELIDELMKVKSRTFLIAHQERKVFRPFRVNLFTVLDDITAEYADFPTFILNLIFHINTSFPFCLPTCIDKL